MALKASQSDAWPENMALLIAPVLWLDGQHWNATLQRSGEASSLGQPYEMWEFAQKQKPDHSRRCLSGVE